MNQNLSWIMKFLVNERKRWTEIFSHLFERLDAQIQKKNGFKRFFQNSFKGA